ncbi:hypothetical protein F5051DRAFT_434479 [Lentinula edodes]|nr:hypothetical protein F5051DRAFT_434479 [Lentinula edodes]
MLLTIAGHSCAAAKDDTISQPVISRSFIRTAGFGDWQKDSVTSRKQLRALGSTSQQQKHPEQALIFALGAFVAGERSPASILALATVNVPDLNGIIKSFTHRKQQYCCKGGSGFDIAVLQLTKLHLDMGWNVCKQDLWNNCVSVQKSNVTKDPSNSSAKPVCLPEQGYWLESALQHPKHREQNFNLALGLYLVNEFYFLTQLDVDLPTDLIVEQLHINLISSVKRLCLQWNSLPRCPEKLYEEIVDNCKYLRQLQHLSLVPFSSVDKQFLVKLKV